LYASGSGERVLKGDLADPNSANAFTLVNGRLLPEQIAEALQLVNGAGDTIYAISRFQSAGETQLKLTGAEKAWLDGQPIDPKEARAGAGVHTVAVQLNPKALPPVLRAETPEARFLSP
jgi:hypothetical protein